MMKLKSALGAIGALVLIAAPVFAQQADNRRVPTDAIAMKSSFAPVVRRTAPAVVNVFTKRVVRQQADPFWGQFLGAPRDRVQQSLGSGAIVRADGIVVTNYHVIENMTEIQVVLADRRSFEARVLLADKRSDMAVLKIEVGAERLPVLNIAPRDDLEVGDLVLAMGNPFGVGQTVTNGIVSALARTDVGVTDYSFFIQTDAAINPGNSGGPLVDMDGDLVGLNSAIYSRTGASNGIGFAIPAAMVRQVVDSALGGQARVNRPWLGVSTKAITPDMTAALRLSAPQGVLIIDNWRSGPAFDAGLREGDIILSVDGQSVNDPAGLNYRIGTKRPGDQAVLRYRRDGQELTATARVESPPRQPAADQRKVAGRNPLDGATVINLSPGEAEQRGLDPFASGVVVSELGPGYAAQRAGVRPGDIIAELNGVKIDTTSRLEQVIAANQTRQWTLTVIRAGQPISARFSV